MAKRLQAAGAKGYENGFEPTFDPRLLKRRYGEGDVVFVGSMGDVSFQPFEVQERIVKELIEPNSEATFFLESKNPSTFIKLLRILPENVILSTTIETNRDYNLTKAPVPFIRYIDFRDLYWDKKHVSIEPIMEFDFHTLIPWIKRIAPLMVSVGYDNYNCGLPEPTRDKTEILIRELEKFTKVERKAGLM